MPRLLLCCVLLPAAALVLSACPAPGCAPDDNPDLTIGKGAIEFADLDDGGRTVPLVFGTQGGFHIDIALAVTGGDVAVDEEIILLGTVDGREVAESYPQARFRCNAEAGALEASALRLVVFESPSTLDGELLTIDAELTDKRDVTISATETDIVIDASGFQ